MSGGYHDSLPPGLATLHRLVRWMIRAAIPPRRGEALARTARAWAEDLAAREKAWDSGGPPRLKRLATGRQSCVFRWEHPERGTVVLRAWPHAVPAHHARDHVEAARLLHEAGLLVPRILARDDSFRARRRFRLEAIVEELGPGDFPDPSRPVAKEVLARIGAQLARMHATRGAEWGRPWRNGGTQPPRAAWLRRVDSIRDKVARYGGGGLTPQQWHAALARARTQLAGLDFGEPRLVHGDMNPGNLLVDDAGGITWIDLQTVHFGHPQEDLSGMRRWLEPLGQYGEFLEEYRRALGATGEEVPQEDATLELILALDKLAMHTRRLEKGKTRTAPERLEEGREWYARLARRLLDADGPERTEGT